MFPAIRAFDSPQDVIAFRHRLYGMKLLGEKLIITAVLVPVAIFLAVGIALALDPDFSLQQFGYPGCLMKRGFGLPCPLCGGAEAFAAGLRGDLAGAWAANPFACLFLLTLGVSAACLVVALAWPGSVRPLLRNRILILFAAGWGVLLLIILVFHWLARLL